MADPPHSDRTTRPDDGGEAGARADEGADRARSRGAWDDDWDRGSWDRDDWDDDDWGGPGRAVDESREGPDDGLSAGKPVGYTARKRPERRGETSLGRRLDRGHQVAFMLLAGIGLGAGIGYGLDRLIGTFPALMLVGVFVGFGIALYAVFIETR